MADTVDSKSIALKSVPVQVRPPAPVFVATCSERNRCYSQSSQWFTHPSQFFPAVSDPCQCRVALQKSESLGANSADIIIYNYNS